MPPEWSERVALLIITEHDHLPLYVSLADHRGGRFIRGIGACVNSLLAVRNTCIIARLADTRITGDPGLPVTREDG